MSKAKLKIHFAEPEILANSQKLHPDLNPHSSRLRITSRQVQTRQTSRSSKVSPDNHHFSRKSSEIILPLAEISDKKKSQTKSTGKLPRNFKKNYTPVISPKIQSKPGHRRIYSDCPSNIYKSKILSEIKQMEKETAQKKSLKRHQKVMSYGKIVFKSEKEQEREASPYLPQEELEKKSLAKYISQYFLQYNDCPQTSIEFYRVVNLIGKGAFGKVLLCEHRLTGKKVAIKAIPKAQLQNQRSQKKVFQEVYILRKIKSRYVIKILEVFESDKNFLMVLEYAGGGDLLHYVRDKGKLKEEEAKKIFKQIVQGALVIHEAGILHRDFKLDNILIDSSYSTIKICDFGVSKIVKPGEIIMDQCGTPAYLAPEIIKNEGYEGYTVDIWSIGIVLYTMICGTIPFRATNISDLHKVILSGVFDIPNEVSETAKDLLRKMIVVEPSERCSLQDVLTHPWFMVKNVKDVDKTIPQFCPRILKENNPEEIREINLSAISELGFSYDFVMKSLRNNEMNHATATYFLLS